MSDTKDSSNTPKKEAPKAHDYFLTLSDAYLTDLECLREMFTLVLPVLNSQDEDRQTRVNDILKSADKEDKLAHIVSQKESARESITFEFSVSQFTELTANLKKLRRADTLFRHHAIVGIVSRYDEFLAGILFLVLEAHPEWLRSSEKTITYKELIELKSVALAMTGVIRKEIDTLMRGSHAEQIEFLDEKLKLGINEHFKRLPEFLELAERRNLFVHTGGQISQQYLENCRRYGAQVAQNLQLHDRLRVDEAYFQNAFEIAFELGLRVSQSAYRRLFPENLEAADKSLNHLAVRFLSSADWGLAENIADFNINIPEKLRARGEYRYFAIINRAVAQKFSGKKFDNGLAGIDWDAFHPKYKLAIQVLNDDFDSAEKSMQSDAVKEAIDKIGFRSWPLFRTFRDSPQFVRGYKALFNEDYIPDLRKDVTSALPESDVK